MHTLRTILSDILIAIAITIIVVVLAVFLLPAIWLMPDEPKGHTNHVN